MSGSYGENETLDRTYSEFRNSGYSLDSEDRGRITSRNIRELLSLAYTFNPEKGTNINLDLYRSSGRLPDNNALSPRRVWQSQYSYTVGNENLEPGWGYDIDLSYTLRNKLTISYGGTWSRGSETMTFYDPDDPNIVYTTKVNGEHGSAHNIWIDYTTLVTKWFRVKSFIHGYWYRREVDGDWQASYSAGGGMFSLSLMFQPHPSMIIYLDGGVELPQKRLETWQNSYWALAAGITKSFCKDKLYISLDVNNILSTKLKKETVRWDNSYYSVLRQPRGHRSLRLVFSIGYRFNRNAKKSVSTVQTLRDPEEILK